MYANAYKTTQIININTKQPNTITHFHSISNHNDKAAYVQESPITSTFVRNPYNCIISFYMHPPYSSVHQP